MQALVSIMAGVVLAGSFGVAHAAHSDIVSNGGIRIGSAFVPWGGSVVLDEGDALLRANGRCAFRFSYLVANNGKQPTGPFKNFLTTTTPQNTVAINPTAGLAAGESRQVSTQSFLVPGSYGLILRLDAENTLAESNESNNGYFINIVLKGQCQGQASR